ncbi:MAG: DUF1611 domain-containing protein [Acidobacteria bacterium]|nr:MAG: DUF1611 domain-containing protein [Acidobacteriota bacterium]
MSDGAVLIASGLYRTIFAKTSHGLVRGPSRFPIAGVVDPGCAGEDAGELLDGRRRGIPIYPSLSDLLARAEERPRYCIVGVATVGGVLPPAVRDELLVAAGAGMTILNGLHQPLAADAELARAAAEGGAAIVDFRQPKPLQQLRFWTGEVLSLAVPRVAVLGTDCALGKRTTAGLLRRSCRARGLRAELVFTGQTGWLQGYEYGFFLDATPNDFVCGELEGAILACARDASPDLILLEGQSALRNPSGPCGAELLLAGGARHVVLQHAPGRQLFEDLEELGCRIPPVADEVELIGRYGAEVVALTLNDQGLDAGAAEEARARLAAELELPVVYPLRDGVEPVVDALVSKLGLGR